MRTCCVPNCPFSTAKNLKVFQPKTLFSFPKDKKTKEIWKKALELSSVKDSAKVFEGHFPTSAIDKQ